MPVLTRTMRFQLLELLKHLPAFDTKRARNGLLVGLPDRLVNQIERSDAKAQDLQNIIIKADEWWPDANTTDPYPLRQLIENACSWAGPEHQKELRLLLAALPERLDPEEEPIFRKMCPYPGMAPFTANDARYFYGREVECEDLLLRLQDHSMLTIIGPSGSGKSSLIFAGLLPALARQQPTTWDIQPMRPGPQPMVTLTKLLGGDLTDPASTIAAHLKAHAPATRLLLVIDQFEEVFRQGERNENELANFFSAIETLRALPTCTPLLAMRADFYPDLMQSELWDAVEIQRYEIVPLREDALSVAIREPALDVGVEVEEELVERLRSHATGQPGSLPLLQQTLVHLWRRMNGRTLTLKSYEALGREGRSGLEVALATWADATLAALTPEQRIIARRIFLRLIAFGEGRPDMRRQQPVAALRSAEDDPSQFDQTLDVLTLNRLLTLSGEEKTQGREVDLAHEALISGWPKLRQWIKQRREAEQSRRRLEVKVAEWVRLGRGTGGLLDRAQLLEAEEWLAGADAAELGYSADLLPLIQASRAAIKQADQKELARAQAEVQVKEQTLRARILGGATLLLLAAVGVAVFLGFVAYQQSVIVRAQALAANAVAQLDVDPERSLHLAMEAVSTTQRIGQPVVPQAHEALDQALARSRALANHREHHDDVTSVAYSPDGEYFATGSKERSVRIWRWKATTGKLEVATVLEGKQGHKKRVHSVAFSSDGKRLISASEDKTVKIWNTANWQPVTGTLELSGDRNQALDAAYSPDGRFIVVADREKQTQIWDTQSSQWVHTFTGHEGPVTSASYSPDGQHVLTSSRDNTVRVWDVVTGTIRHEFKGHTHVVNHARYSPDGATIVSASEDSTARIWDVTRQDVTRQEERLILRGHNEGVYDARYSPDGRTIVTASADKTAKIWDAATGVERFTLRGHTDAVMSATYSPDGRTIVTVSVDQTVRVWDATDQLTWVMRAVYDQDGRFILSAGSDGTARVWEVMTQQPLTQQPVITITGHTGLLYSALFSPDQKHIVTASGDKTAKVWAIPSLEVGAIITPQVITQPVKTLTHAGPVTSAAYSPDGKHIVTTSRDGRDEADEADDADEDKDIDIVVIWDAIGNQPPITLTHEYDLFSAAYSPDSKRIVAGSEGKIAVIWDVMTPEQGMIPASTPALTLERHTDLVYDAVFSPDGTRIATSSADRTVKIWDASNRKLDKTLRGHEDVVRRVAYSPDGNFIITAGWDNTARIWDAKSGQLHFTLRGHRNWVMSAAFSRDGKNIVTTSADGTMHQRPINIDELLALAKTRVTRSLTAEEKSTYLGTSCALSLLGICLR